MCSPSPLQEIIHDVVLLRSISRVRSHAHPFDAGHQTSGSPPFPPANLEHQVHGSQLHGKGSPKGSAADAALYESKAEGRNKVTLAMGTFESSSETPRVAARSLLLTTSCPAETDIAALVIG